MTKFLKKVSLLLLFIFSVVVSFCFNLKVNAESLPNSISGITALKDLNYNGYDQLIHKTYGSGVLFCATFHTPGVGTSCNLSSKQWSLPTQAGVAAVVDKYNKSASEKNYYYAELAINEFLYYFETKDEINRINSTRDVRNTSGVKGFYDVAVKAYNDNKNNFEVKLTTDQNKLIFNLDGDYYISDSVTVSGTDKYTATVTGVKDAEIYNKSGNIFYVRVPSNSIEDGKTVDVKVTVKASKGIAVAKKYTCGSGNQELIPNKTEEVTVSDSEDLSGTITKEKKVTKLKISKQDITDKKELPGATLLLTDANGNKIDEWVSEDKPHYIEGLKPGKYILTETISPKGYKLNEETIEFNLEANNEVTEVVMYNTHISKYKVKVSKQDITTKKELPGATLIIKDANGNEVARWVSGEEPYYLELEKGNYILSEIQAPNGYDLSYEVIKFSVGDDGEVETLVVMYNSKTPDTADKNIALVIIFMLISGVGTFLSVYKIKHQK